MIGMSLEVQINYDVSAVLMGVFANLSLFTQFKGSSLMCAGVWSAARIRDHPFMKLHREIMKQRELGDQDKTTKLQMELEQAIDDSLRPSQSHSV